MSDVSIKEERKPYDKSEYFSGTQILDQVNLDFIFINSHCLLDENERINLAKNIHQIGQVFSKYTDNNINSVWIGVFDIRKLDTDEFKERGVQWNYWKNSIHVRFGSSEEKVLVYSWSDTNQFNQDEWNNLLSQLEGDREVKFIGTGPLTLKYKGFNYRVYPPLLSSLDGKEGYLSNTEVFSFSPTEVNQIIEDIKESHQSIEKKIIDHYQSLAKNLAENNKGYIEIKAGIDIKNAGIVKNFTDVSYTNKSDDIRNKPIEEAFIKEEERNNVGNLLHLGVYTNNKSFMKQFFGVIDVNEVNKNDRTPLHLAAKYGRKDIVEMLLNKEAKVDVVDNRGRTPLHLAAQYNEKKEIVEMLLKKEAKVDIADNRGRTPLHWAAQNNNKEIVDTLIKAKANVNIKDEDERTPFDLATEGIQNLLQSVKDANDKLLKAAKSSNIDDVKNLLNEEGKAQVNAKDNNGYTPLHWAAFYDKKGVVKALLDKGANVDATDKYGWTPLHWAAIKDNKDAVKALLDKGANVKEDNDKRTPLHWAAKNGHEDVVKALLKVNGINVDAKDKDRKTPLHLAAEDNNKEVVDVLIKARANVNATDKYGYTPLHLAAANGHQKVVKALLDKNEINVNATDKYGWTPLHLAASGGKKDVVEALLDKGANVDVQNDKGETPLHLAARNNNKEIVDTLIKAKANVNIKDEDGNTPFNLATDEKIKTLLQPAEESDPVNGSSTESKVVQEKKEEDSNQSQGEQDINGEKGTDVTTGRAQPVAHTQNSVSSVGGSSISNTAQTEEQPSSFFGSLFSILMKPFSLIASFFGGFFSVRPGRSWFCGG